MPEIVFWNVDDEATSFPVTKDEYGTKLISGANKNIIDIVCSDFSKTPEDFMKNVITKYAFIDDLFKEESND